ncbi:Fanconi anemia group C protein isoform X1 [Bombina bombina]|uniref:Fanconi anemia group C protein isoform X1 n=1 Tax=Bombina bombina TaxID=8345 RepID=UPI00235AE104|nr:Fanconi anemia group C protein isoform X1 [Bombina bombina]
MAHGTPSSSEEFEFWLNKAITWGEKTTLESQQDVCHHLPKLQEFLLQIYEIMNHMSPSVAIHRFPVIGQLLGRLCWNSFVIGHEDTRKALLNCLSCLHSNEPHSAVELKANKWIQNLLCHLFSSSDLGFHEDYKAIDQLGCMTSDYYEKLLKNIISSLIVLLRKDKTNPNSDKKELLAGHVRSISIACVHVLTLPEITPLLEELLVYHDSEPTEALDDIFLESVNNAILWKKIVLSESAVLSLWLRHLPSLEKTVLDLFQKLIGIQSKSLKEMEQIIKDSFLVQAACHPSIFKIIDGVFRNALLECDGNFRVITVIRVFTHHFIKEYQKDNMQARFPLRAFFPCSNLALLMALLRVSLGLPFDVCLQHLQYITKMLKNEDGDKRSHGNVFESWFLLIHFGDWVDIAAEQLLTSESETSDDLLWLLAFYYNPSNENQERCRTMTEAREVHDTLIRLRRSVSISASDLKNIIEDGIKENNWDPCTLHLVRHLFVTFLIFSSEWHLITKDVIIYMTQTEEAANQVSDVLGRTLCRLDIPGMKNEPLIKIAYELLSSL